MLLASAIAAMRSIGASGRSEVIGNRYDVGMRPRPLANRRVFYGLISPESIAFRAPTIAALVVTTPAR
jgi:hypothetical protein